MKNKNDVLGFFLKWKAQIENQRGRNIIVLRIDNGEEYKSDPFLEVCQDCGINRHFAIRRTPQQNGVSEHMNKTLVEKVHCMLSNVGLEKKGVEDVTYAQHLVNCQPSSVIGGKTPLGVWFGKPAIDYDTLHVFGSTAHYHVIESKLDPCPKKALFMGFNAGVKGYRLWCLEAKNNIITRDVIFNESAMLNKVILEKPDYTPMQTMVTPRHGRRRVI